MSDKYVLLEVAQFRLQFWQSQLQSAFRDDNRERVAACEGIIAEYAVLVGECINSFAAPSGVAQAIHSCTAC
jgi:hypothetical protein